VSVELVSWVNVSEKTIIIIIIIIIIVLCRNIIPSVYYYYTLNINMLMYFYSKDNITKII
jgi:hypothetical protein